MKNILLLFVLFSFSFCTYSVRSQERLESDQLFLKLSETDPAFRCNHESLVYTKKGDLNRAELAWDSCLKEFPKNIEIHLNRIRFYYILEEYDVIKKKIETDAPARNSPVYTQILQSLYDRLRWEERVIVLDALSRVNGWELYSYEELANYYLHQANFTFAESYYNQVLEINPFHEDALFGMTEIQTHNEKWHSVLDYAKSLTVAAKKNKDFHYFLLKANFELGRYAEGLKWVENASDKEKSQISFLEVWRDLLLLTKDKPNWNPLLPYYRKAVAEGYAVPESVFFPTLDPSGREVRKAIRTGRE
ncbi:tetratricopeptide repeat protein [Leptospira sp. 'Mane']|uniref:tetratricopeptide repeat protein n=1 Tax=Leptospira sp. 'Mane' TaxID=3387407 RepID=UPI00398A67B7